MQAWHSSTRCAKQPPMRLDVDCYPVIIQNPSVARSFLGIAVIWITDHQHASLQRSVFHKRLLSKKEVCLLQRARVTPRQRAGALGTSRRSDWPQEMEERVLGHPPEAVGMSWFLSLGRTFLTPNGAIATGYATHLDAAPGEKYAFPENLPCEEGFFCRGFLLVFFCREAANYSKSAARLPPSLLLLSKAGGLRKGP